ERLKREYHSIRQTNTETSTEFMQRFLRLAGFLGAAAGTEEEQAKNSQWGLRRSTLNHLMCMSYTDVAQVANAACNYEILYERDDDDAERPDKRRVVINISRPLNRVVTGTTVIIVTVMDQTGEAEEGVSDTKRPLTEEVIEATVDGKKVIIFKASIIRDLQFGDAEGVDGLPTTIIFEQLGLMSTIASAIICLATNQKFNFSKWIFESIGLSNHERKYVAPAYTRKSFGNMRRVGNESIADETFYKEFDDSLVRIDTVASSLEAEQDSEIDSLKRRVKKLEKKQRSRTHKLKRLYKVSLTAKVESSNDNEDLGEDASKRQRISDIDADEDITLVSTHDDVEMFDADKDLHGEEVFVAKQDENIVEKEVDVAQVQVTTAATTTIILIDEVTLAQALSDLKHTKPKAKAKTIVFHELEESTTTTIPKPKSQEKEKRRKLFATKGTEEKRNKPQTQAQQRKIMCTYLKNMEGKKLKHLKNSIAMSTQQDIYAAGSESRPPMLNKENYMPWSSRLLRYAKIRPNGKLTHNSILNGPYVRRMIPEPGDANRKVTVTETFHVQTDDELSDEEIKQIEADDQAIQTILLAPHQDQSSFNQNYLQQPMPNPEDITDPITAMNMALALMAKAFKLNYSTPNNNNQRISSNPRNWQIAQLGINMGQDRQMQMVGGNGGNQFRQYAGNLAGNGNQNQIGNGNLVATRAKGNAAGQNGNQIRCYNCRGVEEYDLMAATANLDEIEEVNVNCILMANLQQASTSGTQTDSAPIYDSDGSTENDNDVISEDTSVEQCEETVEQHPVNFEETCALYESLYQNLAIEVEKVNSKPNTFYHTKQKMALGYQNPFYLKQAQKKQQSLYDGKVLLEKYDPPIVHDSEETLQLAQESREKMKQLNKEIKPANYPKINHLSGDFSDDTTQSVARKFLNEVKSTIVTLQHVDKHRMTIETHNLSSYAHQELHKIVRDEIFPIVNQVDARVQNFKIQFLKEAAKFVGDFKSLANEADASLAKHKALELEIERL
nr:zinc finger, CCHC-type, retrotransposon Gag domain protein [Tanacetum cinerariifolium]